jgi:hypothetical protein
MGWDITFAQLPVLRSGHRHTLIMGQQPLSQIRNRTSAATCVYFTGGILAPPHVDGLAISYPVKLVAVPRDGTYRGVADEDRTTSFAPQATFFHFGEYSQASFVVG